MKRLIALTIAAFALVLATGAAANVLIYQNGFSSKKDVKQIEKLQGGGKCKDRWKGGKAFGVRVNKGNRNCLWRTPVQGDRNRPDHVMQAVVKVKKKTNKRIRRKVYAGLAVRANRKSGYEVRIFPKGRRWHLLKNGEKVGGGRSKAIDALNNKNRVRLSALGNEVVAKVNGKRLAKFTDRAANEVVGQKTAVAFGSTAKANKDGFGVIDRVKVLIPSP